MATGCLGIVALCGGIGYAALHYLPLPPGGDPTVTRIFAALVGCFGGLGLSSVWSLLRGHGRGGGARGPLHARARSDAPPEDGQPIIATGVVRADRPLTSPVGGVACAAYDYRMFVRTTTTGSKTNEVPVYWGYAAQPFSIDSRSRSYPVLGTGLQAEKATPLGGDAAVARARQYVRSTGWETVEYRMLGALDTGRQRLEDDSVTGTRKDFAADGNPPDVALLQLEETVLPIGETVSAFGAWSAARGAIIAPPSPLPGSHVVVARGGPEALDGQGGVPHSTTSYIVGAIVLLALAAGVFWFGLLVIPTVG